jgi:hypothetical protein
MIIGSMRARGGGESREIRDRLGLGVLKTFFCGCMLRLLCVCVASTCELTAWARYLLSHMSYLRLCRENPCISMNSSLSTVGTLTWLKCSTVGVHTLRGILKDRLATSSILADDTNQTETDSQRL